MLQTYWYANTVERMDGDLVSRLNVVKDQLAALLRDIGILLGITDAKGTTFVSKGQHVLLVELHVEHGGGDEHLVTLEFNLWLSVKLDVSGFSIGVV